jgi:hypothetical protein
MWACAGVDATLSQAQPLHRPPAHQVLLHNLRCIFRLYVAVPHCLGVHHHRRSMLALVQATRFVNPHLAVKPGLPAQLFQPRMQFALAIARAGGPRCIDGADVVADKNVALKRGQEGILLGRPIMTGRLQSNASPTPKARVPGDSLTEPQPSYHPYAPAGLKKVFLNPTRPHLREWELDDEHR